jgi:AcrR family transcriptional regulator
MTAPGRARRTVLQKTPVPLLDTTAQDGRVQRGARNHALIVQAIYDLVRAGSVEPTVEDVAARAGVGVRTIFRQFNDLETLSRSLSERVLGEVAEISCPTPPSGQLGEDLPALIARRARVFEHLLPFRRSGRVMRHRVMFLQEQDAQVTRMLREGLRAVLLPHLREGSDDLLEALDLLLSFEAWERLRSQQNLSAVRAEQVLVTAAQVLAAAAHAHQQA